MAEEKYEYVKSKCLKKNGAKTLSSQAGCPKQTKKENMYINQQYAQNSCD